MSVCDIAWPGPLPADRLIGRESELDDLYDACQGSAAVVITAPSGVGKTSFIRGAIPYLEDEDVKVLQAARWDQTLRLYDKAAVEHDARLLYCLALGGTPKDAALPSGRFLASHGRLSDLIVVFDQLEELLRYRRALAEQFVALVGRIAKGFGVRHIVIARSEFADGLQPLHQSVDPWHLRLKEITDPATIARIIKEPCEGAAEIDDNAVKQIGLWWESARTEPVTSAGSGEVAQGTLAGVGLLHLQSVLWSFKQWLIDELGPDARRVDLEHLTKFVDQASLAGDDLPTRLIQHAVANYVHQTIARVTSSTERQDQLNPTVRWANGPRLMVARIAPYLSSAGYKIPQAFSSLVPLALQEELTPEQGRTLRGQARTASDRRKLSEGFKVQPAGIALGWPEVTDLDGEPAVTLEMINCLEAGLNALASTDVNILRRFAPGDADPIYDLVHDGLGSALSQWAETILGSPESVIGLIAARSGLNMRHHLDPGTFLDADGAIDDRWGDVKREESGSVVISGLRWIGNRVSERELEDKKTEPTIFRNVVFRNCEFRGTVFKGIRFHTVRFDGCNLQGVAMLGCTFDKVVISPPPDDAYGLDPLTIVSPSAGANVEFCDVLDTTGLFVLQISDGRWKFAGKRLQHVVISSPPDAQDLDLELIFDVDDLAHVTLPRAPGVKARNENANEATHVSPPALHRVT